MRLIQLNLERLNVIQDYLDDNACSIDNSSLQDLRKTWETLWSFLDVIDLLHENALDISYPYTMALFILKAGKI